MQADALKVPQKPSMSDPANLGESAKPLTEAVEDDGEPGTGLKLIAKSPTDLLQKKVGSMQD